jgi:rhodanese-related sulfurtransferase
MFSPDSASKAEKLGYANVKVFRDGMPAWKKAGNLAVTTPKGVKDMMDKDMPQVIIDLRSAADAKNEHIKDAVVISITELATPTSKDRFPADKKAPIVIYAADEKTQADAFKIIRGWGYINTAALRGGIDSWKKEGYPVLSDQLKKAVVYVPKLRPGAIPIEEFKRIADALPPDKFILDVRDADEVKQGMLKGAKNIPVGDITKRLAEIPKDKEVIIHCAVGSRGEMAYHTLKDAGYRARFLDAIIEIGREGKYEITVE